MTVHARRYGRWCREHFDTAPESGQESSAQQAMETSAAANVTDAQAEQAQAGDVPQGRPGSLT
ncbi:hypothetical protein [Amycolatopsis regifaucium]|uniref:Uncharacterized protein n=1 Tax=Amycolatopsis regifaucium TaxID=546365 RepID=A0A154MEE6_9PSEU|nr:hypothetical protein [Amycolatopsis regifaucium]KZB82901.1 hypothetical protein AVL48_37265 [Amycolatopsis regifaucium]OKA03348.1 hypothetical protein ATP06_0236695 [Amycolatopsis regifaucium]SFJ68004.1 hypothetical protein SAMN04489731_13022 [Amycolatopsis regifaucium]